MVALTKKEKYTNDLVFGLLDNRPALDDLKHSDLGSDTIPVIDFEIALKRTQFTEQEAEILSLRFPAKEYFEGNTEDIAEMLDVSDRRIRQIIESIVDKVTIEMNRGLND